MKRFLFFVFLVVLFGITASTTGCSLFSLDDAGEGILPILPNTSGPASVQFKLVLPDEPRGSVPNTAIRAGTGGTAHVTFRLILVTPGNGKNTTVLTRVVNVDNQGNATASFTGIPAQTVIGEISIENGTIAGKTDFHGASDLNSGNNVLEVSPKGSGHRSDILANVVMAITNISEAIQTAPFNLVSTIENSAATELASSSGGLYNDVLNAVITRGIRPAGLVCLFRSSDGCVLFSEGPASWTKTCAEIWTGTPFHSEGFLVDKILRQGLNGFAYVSWSNPGRTKFAVTRLSTTNGSREKYIINEGPCRNAMVLPNNHILIGGSLDNLPFLFRWDGVQETTLTASTWSSWKGSGYWATLLPGLTRNASVIPFPMVEYVELPLTVNDSIICMARDPQNGQGRIYKVNPDTGSATSVMPQIPLALWANPGDGQVTLGWDPLPGTFTYNLYWNTVEMVSTTTNAGAFIGISNPFVHPARTNETPYFYQLEAVPQNGQNTLSSVIRAVPHVERRGGLAWAVATSVAPFGPRYMAAGTIFNDKLWISGGVTSPTAYLNDAWSSLDGLTWAAATSTATFPGRAGHGLGALHNKLFIVGGMAGYSTLYNDVWSSNDGSTWIQTTAEANFSKRAGHGLLVFDNLLWVIGGYDGNAKNDVWSSPDGASWTRVVETASFPARLHPTVTVYNGRMWLAGGSSTLSSPGLNDVWWSEDGALWTRAGGDGNDITAFRARRLAGLASLGGRLWMIGGRSGADYPDETLISNNGASWDAADGLVGFPGRSGAVTLARNERLWIIGGEKDEKPLAEVLYSQGIATGANLPPTINIISPASGGVVIAPVTILAEAKDVDGFITRVEFFAGPTKVGETTATQPPYLCTWTDAATGTWTLTARATDNRGVMKVSAPTAIFVSDTPGVRLIRSTTTGGEWNQASTWIDGIVPTATDAVLIDGAVRLTGIGTACARLQISPTGHLTVRQWSPGIIIDGPLVNFGILYGEYDTNLYIRGDFTNNAQVTRAASNVWLNLHVFGQFTQNGEYNHNWTNLCGSGPQNISLGAGKMLGGYFYRERPDQPLIALTDLSLSDNFRFEVPGTPPASSSLDMNGHRLLTRGTLYFYDMDIKNCPEVVAVQDTDFSGAYKGVHFKNSSFPLHLNGRTIYVGSGCSVEGNVVLDSGTKLTFSGAVSFNIRGKFTNNGVVSGTYVQGAGTYLNLVITGDLVQNGDYTPNETYFVGTVAQNISVGTGKSLHTTSWGSFWDTTPESPLVAQTDIPVSTDIVFKTIENPTASPTIDMNGHKLIGVTTMTFNGHKILNLREIVSTNYVSFPANYGGVEFQNPGFPLTFKGPNIQLGGSCHLYGDAVVASEAILSHTGACSFLVHGNLTNLGTITGPYVNSDDYLNIHPYGNLVQDGIYTPNETFFRGSDVQSISMASSSLILGNIHILDSVPSFRADTDLRLKDLNLQFDNGMTRTIDMNGHSVIFEGGINASPGLRFDNCPGVTASGAVGFRYADSFTFSTPSNITVTGAFILSRLTTFNGNVIVSKGSDLRCPQSQDQAAPSTMVVNGNLTNRGYMEDFLGGSFGTNIMRAFYVRVSGNMSQEGTFSPSALTMTGNTAQNISQATETYLFDPVWAGEIYDTDPSSPITAGSDFRFRTVNFRLGSDSASGTLDMNGFGVRIEARQNSFGDWTSMFGLASTSVTNFGALIASGPGVSYGAIDNDTFTCYSQPAGLTISGRSYISGAYKFIGKTTIASGSLITTSINPATWNNAGIFLNYGTFYSVYGGQWGYPQPLILDNVQQPFQP
ncbi:MAG: Ig-like domain-containing protein [Candidatus Ozemobacteraceae bacterium]